MRRPLTLLAAVLALAAGCLAPDSDGGDGGPPAGGASTEGEWRVSECRFGPPSDAALPALLVARAPDERGVDARIVRLEPTASGYREAAVSKVLLASPPWPAPRPAFVQLGEHVFAYALAPGAFEPSVVRLDARTLRVTAELDPEPFGSMTVADGLLYVAGDNLTVYDADLRRLGRVELPLKSGWGGKLAHDALVHDGIAYLIDDVVMPLFILQVDVRDPHAPRVIERRGLDIIGGHLPGHWIDAAAGRWMVLKTWGHRGGGGQDVHAFPLEGIGEGVVVHLQSSTYAWDEGRSSVTHVGNSIWAHTEATPLWAVVGNDSRALFGRVDVDAREGSVSVCAYPLPGRVDRESLGRAAVHREGRFVAAVVSDALLVVDEASDPPALLHSERLDGPVAGVRVAA